MLTNVDIERMAPKMNIPLAMCGFKDELPRTLEANKYYSINLEDEQDKESKQMNNGSHWVGFQVRTTHNGSKPQAVYFDSYGKPPPKSIVKAIKKTFDVEPWYPTKDVQSMVADSCGWWNLAWAHFVNDKRFMSESLKKDTELFIEPFNDLNLVNDYHFNEWLLKHFFQSKDKNLQKQIPIPNVVKS